MKKILLSGLSALALIMASCGDYLDINQNPNYPTEVAITSILPVGQAYSCVALGYTTQLTGSFWVQHYTQNVSANQYWNIIRYQFDYTHTFVSAQWATLYRSAIPSLRDCIEQANLRGDDYIAYVAACEIMEAFDWYILNSLYDQIAFDNGIQGEGDLSPVFNTIEESYDRVIDMLETILQYDLEQLNISSTATMRGLGKDMVFDGDMNGWLKFANTIYLNMLMRDFQANRTKIQSALASTIGFLDATSGDATFTGFADEPNKSNPLYEGDRRQLNSNANIRACESTMDYLLANSDPRVSAFYEPLSDGTYVGATYSLGGTGTDTSRARLAPLDPVYFASVAQAYFLKAEAYARLGNTAMAKANYDSAVEAAFDRWDLDGSSFVAAGGAYEFDSTGGTESMIKQIIMQKWLASVRCQAWDAWFDLNRTGYPERGTILEDYSGALGTGNFPRRLFYPSLSSDYNPNSPTLVGMEVKMWWHKQ